MNNTHDTAHTAADAAAGVGSTAKAEAGHFVGDVKDQARGLFDSAKSEVHEQTLHQQRRSAEGLHSTSARLASMADSSEEQDLATGVVREVSRRTESAATWLEQHEPGDLMHEVAEFARRKPGLFVALAAGAGVVLGRVTRAAMDSSPDSENTDEFRTTSGVGDTSGTPTTVGGPAGRTVPPVMTPVPDSTPIADSAWEASQNR